MDIPLNKERKSKLPRRKKENEKMKRIAVTVKDRDEYCKKHLCPRCEFNGKRFEIDDCTIESWETKLVGKVPEGKVVRFKTELRRNEMPKMQNAWRYSARLQHKTAPRL